jgi:hypothetical protein
MQRLAATLAALALGLSSVVATAQDVKWRKPSVLTSQPATAPRAASKLKAPTLLAPESTAQIPFRPPTVETLQPPVLPSVVPTQPPAVLSTDPLPPPFTVSPTTPGPTTKWDPLGDFFSHADDTIPEIEEWESHTTPIVSHIPPGKPGLFQKFGVSGSWVEGGTDGRAPAIADLSAFNTIAVPFPIREWPLNITTGADARTVDGPKNPDLPPTLYDAYVDFTWNLRITQRSSHVFSFSPGYYSDFQQNSAHALRVTGKWVGAYEVVRNRITLLTGTIYVGRDDLKMLPMGGLVFTPNDWSRYEAIFPNPRASLRLQEGPGFEDWVYLGCDFFGGQTYAIERANGAIDRVSLADNRFVHGFERRRPGGAGWYMESGWVFDRHVHYHNNPAEDFYPMATYYVRMGFTL